MRSPTGRCLGALAAMVLTLGGCSRTSSVNSGPGEGQPALELTPSQRTAVAALSFGELGRRGNPLAMLGTTRDLLGTTVACDGVAEHLGVPLPSFPSLTGQGFTTACGSSEGASLFDHPVPSAANPPPPAADPATEQHSVVIVYLPPGVVLDSTDFDDARARGLAWFAFGYGGDIAQPPSTPATTEPAGSDFTTLAFPDGTPVGVQYMDPADTRIAWASTVSDHRFNVSLDVSGDPVAGVALLADGVDLPS